MQQIHEVLPGYGDGFLAACLDSCGYNVERVIAQLLEGNLPGKGSTLYTDWLHGNAVESFFPKKEGNSAEGSAQDMESQIVLETQVYTGHSQCLSYSITTEICQGIQKREGVQIAASRLQNRRLHHAFCLTS